VKITTQILFIFYTYMENFF